MVPLSVTVPEPAVKRPAAVFVQFLPTVKLPEGAVSVPPVSVRLPRTLRLPAPPVKVPPLIASPPEAVIV